MLKLKLSILNEWLIEGLYATTRRVHFFHELIFPWYNIFQYSQKTFFFRQNLLLIAKLWKYRMLFFYMVKYKNIFRITPLSNLKKWTHQIVARSRFYYLFFLFLASFLFYNFWVPKLDLLLLSLMSCDLWIYLFIRKRYDP